MQRDALGAHLQDLDEVLRVEGEAEAGVAGVLHAGQVLVRFVAVVLVARRDGQAVPRTSSG